MRSRRRHRRQAIWFFWGLYWLGFPFLWLFHCLKQITVRVQRLYRGTASRAQRRPGVIPPAKIEAEPTATPAFAYDWLSLPWWREWQFSIAWLWLSGRHTRRFWKIILTKKWLRWWGAASRRWEQIRRVIAGTPRWIWAGTVGMGAVAICATIFYASILRDLPSPTLLRERRPIVSTKIYDRNGVLLYTLFKDQNRTLVSLPAISPYVTQATIAIEDANFYSHWGISFHGMLRALVHNVQNDSLHGGSTITQQLVKNTLLSPERTWRRKIREIILSLAVDALYSKDEILQYYLNEVNYGGSVHGIEEAGQWYFGKSAKDLSLAESAFLAGLPQAPSLYSPFGVNPQRAVDREKEVLRRMEEDHYISAAQRAEAEQQKLVFTTGTYDIKAPHFVMYVRNILAEKFGEDMVTQGGLNVYTTLDINEQASAEAAVKNEIARLGRINVTNGAAMVTDPRSGQILAMVGSRDYFDTAHDGQVNVTLRSRQPGSSIKPLTYSLAFEHGYTPSTTIQDQPVSYSAPGAPPYAPKNYDGRFHGQVTLREALGSSYNVPAVRLLADLGVPSLVDKGRALGITTWDEASASRFGLALTLGSGEVRMIDMASVYGTFANGGYTVTPQPLLLVTNYNGQVLYRNPCADATEPCGARRTLSALAAYEITSVLSDNGARTPAFGPNSQLYFPGQQIAVKTGTTNVLRDNWTIGYTPERVVLTWVGNNDNKPMSAVASGVTGASPIWHTIMAGLIKDQRIAFTLPSSLEQVKICRLTGTLACAECPQITTEIYPIGMAPKRACTAEMFANLTTENGQVVSVDQKTAHLP